MQIKLIAIIIITLLSSVITNAQKRDKFYTSMEITNLSLNALDLGTTLYALDNGAIEANPFIKNATPLQITAFKIVTTGALLGVGRLMYRRNTQGAKAFIITMNILLSAVVVNNSIVVINLNKSKHY